jgi:hypothetical protein
MAGDKRRATSVEREAVSPKRQKFEGLDSQVRQDDVNMVM